MKKKTSPEKKSRVKLHKRLPKKLDDDAYAYNAMIIEDLKSSFGAVVENQRELSGKVDVLTHDAGTLKKDVREIKISQDIMRGDITEIKDRQTRMEADITEMKGRQTRMETDIKEIKQELKSIRSEMAELRTLISQKADIDRFNRLEERVARIEQTLQSRQ